MESKIFRYEINGKTYFQKRLVLGQIRQLAENFQDIEFPKNLRPKAVMEALGEKLPIGIAIVLTEEGRSPRNKNLGELAANEFDEFSIDGETVLQVIEDFFDCNPVVSLLERLAGITIRMARAIPEKSPDGSMKSSSFSPEEISPDGTKSSGGMA